MPIILVCGDDLNVKKFCEDFEKEFENVSVHTNTFSEAISDVIQSDLTVNHLITTSLTKPDRYITFCHAKRFKTAYLVIFFDGSVPDDLEIPSKEIRHDNPLIECVNYENKSDLFEEIRRIISAPVTKKSFSNHKVLRSSDYFNKVKETVKNVQKKYPFDEEIFLETENRLMNMISQSKKEFNVEIVYEEILEDSLRERGLID